MCSQRMTNARCPRYWQAQVPQGRETSGEATRHGPQVRHRRRVTRWSAKCPPVDGEYIVTSITQVGLPQYHHWHRVLWTYEKFHTINNFQLIFLILQNFNLNITKFQLFFHFFLYISIIFHFSQQISINFLFSLNFDYFSSLSPIIWTIFQFLL